MSTMVLAMWLQEADPTGNRHLVLILVGVIALGVAVTAIILVAIGVKVLGVIKELGATAAEVKTKMLPVIDEVLHISKTGRVMLEDAVPKVRLISENLVKTSDTIAETSRVARAAVQQVESTISDANRRTQRQVARVDGMVTAALTTTAEVTETISHGIRVPAQKIASMLGQAKTIGEGLLEKMKGIVEASPFGGRER